ncbi:unnamed protein product [Closterium sp. NIES-53]
MAYISRCRGLRDRLLRCGGSISEEAFVTVIIAGLGPHWRSTRAHLRAHGKISEVTLCAEIHAEQQDMYLHEERHKKKALAPEFAFHTQRRYNNNNNRHNNRQVQQYVPPFCHLCKTRPVAVSLADPSGGPVLSHFSTVLPCPAAPSGTLSGLYLPSFSTNLVSGADLQDGGVHQFTPAYQRVTHCTEASTGRHLATFTRQLGSSLYTLSTPSPPVAEFGRVAASGQVFAAASRSGPESAPCSCRLLSHETLLWHHRLGPWPFLCSPVPPSPPYTEQTGGLTERREPASRAVSPVRTARRAPRSRPPPVPGTHAKALHPSSVPFRVPLPAPPESSLPEVTDPESDHARALSPAVSCLLATAVTDPSFESAAASTLVAELLDFAAAYRLDYATALVAEYVSASPPSVGGEGALGTDVLEDRQEDFECLATAGDPDAPDIPTPCSNAEAITGPYSSQWKAAMDAEMASWKSTGTYVDDVSPPGANIVDGMWIFRRDYELHSLNFSTAFLQGSLHVKIWLRRPPGFTGTFPTGTQWSLRRPVYGLHQAPSEWHDTLRNTLAALGFAPSTVDPSLFLRTDTSLPPFYVLVYVHDLVFATADIQALTLGKSELQKRHTCTNLGELCSSLGLQITRDRARRTITLTPSHMVHQVLLRFGFQFSSPQPTPLSTSHSLSAPPSDESVEPSGPYPELVGCLIMSGMGLVLGGRGPVVLTGHADASWVDDSATQWSSQGYTFSLGFGSVSWRSTRLSLVLSSSCEAEIYAGAMAAQELRWLTYLLTDLGEQPRSPPQRGQLRLEYVATRANTADVFTKELPPGDHQPFSTLLLCLS